MDKEIILELLAVRRKQLVQLREQINERIAELSEGLSKEKDK